MLVTGCANPAGEEAGYNGLYFTGAELEAVVRERRMLDCPVKAEHGGAALGRVVSSYLDAGGRLHCVMHIDEQSVEGAIAAGLVRDGIAQELSLGYAVDVAHSADGDMQAQTKHILEVSLVRKGARDACYVHAYEDGDGVFTRPRAAAAAAAAAADAGVAVGAEDAWALFDLRP